MRDMDMLTKKTLCAGLLVAVFGVGGPTAIAADATSFKTSYDAAEAARKKAASVGFEWRDTRKMLKKAKALADKGDFEKAQQLTEKARFQGDAAYAQAGQQEEGWKAAVVR